MSVMRILPETDHDRVPTVAKLHGVSEQSIYMRKDPFGRFQPDDGRRLK
jgi:hypothetical protein